MNAQRFHWSTTSSKVEKRLVLPSKWGGECDEIMLTDPLYDHSGQTGSGKTYTMLDPRHGLYILAARDIFTMLRKPENEHLTAWIGLYEIYQGQLYDLLNERKKLFAREDGKSNVIIMGLKEYPIDNVNKLVQVFDYGSSVRTTGK